MKKCAAFLVLFLSLSPLACSEEGECASLCGDAQEKDCTNIKGDCDAFCTSLFEIQEPSGCTAEREAYQDCVAEDVCDNRCQNLETTLTSCVTAYCAQNQSDPDCQTLASSF